MAYDMAEVRRFITVWQRGASPEAIATELGMEKGDVQSLASKLRGKGIPLKTFAHLRGRKVSQIDAELPDLVALANSLV